MKFFLFWVFVSFIVKSLELNTTKYSFMWYFNLLPTFLPEIEREY